MSSNARIACLIVPRSSEGLGNNHPVILKKVPEFAGRNPLTSSVHAGYFGIIPFFRWDLTNPHNACIMLDMMDGAQTTTTEHTMTTQTEETDLAETFDVTTHNGWVTIENPKTSEHRTFQIRTVTNEDHGLHGKRIVSLLTGPNREDFGSWTGFGFAGEHGVSVWKKHRGTKFEKMARLLEDIERGEAYGLEYHLTGRCRVCNRKLTNPASIRAGIGPVCASGGM